MKRDLEHQVRRLADFAGFFKDGAKGFFFNRTNSRWRDVLPEEELSWFESTKADVLPPAAAEWIETGGAVNDR